MVILVTGGTQVQKLTLVTESGLQKYQFSLKQTPIKCKAAQIHLKVSVKWLVNLGLNRMRGPKVVWCL